MTRTELKPIVENLMTDEWTRTNSDYQMLTVDECKTALVDIRSLQKEAELAPEECIPDDMTANELHDLWTEIVKEHWEALRSSARSFLLGEGNYDYPFNKYIEDFKERNGYPPHPWVYCTGYDMEFYGKDCDEPAYPIHEFARLAKRSPDYDPDKPFYWYDGDKLHSTDNIYPDICDVETIVNYCIDNQTGLDYAIEELM